MNANTVLEKYLEMFQNPMLNKSALTYKIYQRDLGKFYDYFKFSEISDIENVSKDQFRDFIFSLSTLSNESKNGVIRAISAFVNFLKNEDYISSEKISYTMFGGKRYLPKTKKKEKLQLNDAEIHEIYRACETSQEKFMIALMIYTGLRESSIASIKIADIDETGFFKVRAKGNKLVPIKMSPSLFNLFIEYKKTHDNKKEYLFYPTIGRGAKNEKMSPKTVYERVKSILSRTLLSEERQSEITPHTFRHAFVTQIIKSTKSVEAARQAVHHSNIATTNIYNDDKFGLGMTAMESINFNLG